MITANDHARHPSRPAVRGAGRRRFRQAALICATALLAAAGPASGARADGGDLQGFVVKKAAILSTMHRKAMRALVNAAQDRSFESYFHAHDDQGRRTAKDRIEKVSLATQSRFHVEEMCLIDAAGPEIARIVGSEVAPDSELSPDESGADFFGPAFAEKPRQVYVSQPYLSPDAVKWVIAYVTPVSVDGKNKAVLHYEHGLDIYQAALADKDTRNGRFLVAVSAGGYVVSDSRRRIDVAGRDGKEEPADYFVPIDDLDPQGLSAVFHGIGDKKTGTARFSFGDSAYDVAFARVEGDMVLMAVEQQAR